MHVKKRYEFRSSKGHPKELFTKPACLKRIDYQLWEIICKVLQIQKRAPKIIIQNNRNTKLQQIIWGTQKFNRKIKHYYISSVKQPARKLRGNKMQGSAEISKWSLNPNLQNNTQRRSLWRKRKKIWISLHSNFWVNATCCRQKKLSTKPAWVVGSFLPGYSQLGNKKTCFCWFSHYSQQHPGFKRSKQANSTTQSSEP